MTAATEAEMAQTGSEAEMTASRLAKDASELAEAGALERETNTDYTYEIARDVQTAALMTLSEAQSQGDATDLAQAFAEFAQANAESARMTAVTAATDAETAATSADASAM